jgi:hypothetical protein
MFHVSTPSVYLAFFHDVVDWVLKYFTFMLNYALQVHIAVATGS